MFPFMTGSDQRGATNSTLRAPQVQIDGPPAMREAVDRVIAKMVKSLQTMAGVTTTIEGMFYGLTIDKAKDVIAAHGPDFGAALLECPDMRFPILLTLDATLVHAIVELLCGGNGVEPMAKTPRPVTPIDLQFSQIVFSLAASAIQHEWAEFGFAGTRATKIEGGLPSDLLGPRGLEVVVLKIAIGAFGLHGALRLTMPRTALDRFVRAEDARDAAGAGYDPHWTALFNKQIGQAAVTLDAFLDAKAITLATLANLKVGQILEMQPEARERVTLVNGKSVLYRGELGQAEDLYTMRIEEIVSEQPKPVIVEPRRSSHRNPAKV
jgi:flagellar motor switch protein FliM